MSVGTVAHNNIDRVLSRTMKDKPIQTDSDSNIVLNVCLAFIQSMRPARDKSVIQEATVSGFDLKSIKIAREVLLRYSNPKDRKGYQGPRNSTDTEIAVHAFGDIYAKLKEIDEQGRLPTFACPAEDLRLLPQSKRMNDVHGLCQVKFEHMEAELQELKKTFHTFTNLLTSAESNRPAPEDPAANVRAPPNVSLPPERPVASAIHPELRDRLDSPSSSIGKRRKLSVSDYSTCDEDNGEDGYQLQGPQRRKLARRRQSKEKSPAKNLSDGFAANSRSYAASARSHPKREYVVGRGKVSATGRFKCVAPKVPQLFMTKCDPETEETDVKEYIESEGIIGISVEKISPISFIITVKKMEDFNNMLTGNYVPPGVYVRKYHPRRNFSDGNQHVSFKKRLTHHQDELQLDASRLLDQMSSDLGSRAHSSADNMDVADNSKILQSLGEILASPQDQQVDVAAETGGENTADAPSRNNKD